MDPNATLKLIEDLLTDNDIIEANYVVSELQNWLDRGGFPPVWEQFPTATKFYEESVTAS